MEIYVIRHGETSANTEGRFQGQMDYPLNENGISLAKVTGKALCDVKFDICYSSPLSRAMDTAGYVLEENNNPCQIVKDDRLLEVDVGKFSNSLFRESNASAFFSNPVTMGKIGGGESIEEVMERTQNFLRWVATQNYQRILVSTHGCAMRCMLNFLYENREDFWQGHVPYNCAVSIVSYQDGKFLLKEKDRLYYN